MEIKVNSPENQAIKSAFVGREVLANVTAMAGFVLSTDTTRDTPFTYDDILNYKVLSSEAKEALSELRSTIGDTPIDDIEWDIENNHIDDPEVQELYDKWLEVQDNYTYAEIAEWWIVTEFLMGLLQSHGECVIPHINMWGRQGSGQSIMMDSVINKICLELGLLK